MASADMNARRAVPLLSRGKARHPLADAEGKIPLLVRLPGGADPAAAGLLPVAPGLGAVHLPSAEVPAFLAAHPGASARVSPPRRPLIDYSGRWTRVPEFRTATGLDGTGVVIGIVDTGLDVTHADFRDKNGKTRVRWLLQHSLPAGLHPELEKRFGCSDPQQLPCAILDNADIDALIAAGHPPTDVNGHGTHVASIAAGNGGAALAAPTRYVGVAPGATLIVASPSDQGFSDPDILNAVRFVFDRADDLMLPAVVNLSLGSDFGPHDGTSELERGLEAMVGDGHPGRAIVVAAGNGADIFHTQDGGVLGIHSEVLITPNGVTRVPIRSADQGSTDRPVTVDGAGFVWITFDPGDDVSIGLDGPGNASIPLISPGDDRGWHDDDMHAGVINDEKDTSQHIPSDSTGAVVSFSGKWDAASEGVLRLKGHGHAQLWLSSTGGASLLFQRATKSGTIAVPASAPALIAVGCTVNRSVWRPLDYEGFLFPADAVEDSICGFSGAGPTPSGGLKPDLLAPGGFVAGAMSSAADPRKRSTGIFADTPCPGDPKHACALIDDTHAVASGTSMSSPHVAGAVALLFQKDRKLTQKQVLELLQGSAARPTGAAPLDMQLGSGQLDMLAALAVLDGQLATAASERTSWFVVAAPYLRPDPAHAVSGLVLLRDAGGAAVGDVAPGDLTLVAERGRVVVPVTRVAPGVWRFAIGAEHGSAGSTVAVEVLYRGKSLGQRVLPVAADPWQIGGAVNPVGGCAQAGARDVRGAPAAWLMVGMALGSTIWRRRRTAGRRRSSRCRPRRC